MVDDKDAMLMGNFEVKHGEIELYVGHLSNMLVDISQVASNAKIVGVDNIVEENVEEPRGNGGVHLVKEHVGLIVKIMLLK